MLWWYMSPARHFYLFRLALAILCRARIKFGGSDMIQYLINLGNEIGQCNMSTFISDRETRKTDHVREQAITVNTLIDQVKSARFF